MHGDAVEQLGELSAGEPFGALFDQPQSEVHVPEQAALVGHRERRPASELDRAADVVHQRGREQQVAGAGADAAAPSRGRASRRRPCARAGRRRTSDGRRALPGRRRGRGRRALPARFAVRPGCEISATRNSRKPAQLVPVPPDRRRQRRRIDVGRLERAHVELQPVAELLDAPEHAHRVAFGEAAVEQLDVLPDARLDRPVGSTSSSARYDAPDFVRSLRFVRTA